MKIDKPPQMVIIITRYGISITNNPNENSYVWLIDESELFGFTLVVNKLYNIHPCLIRTTGCDKLLMEFTV